MAIHHLIAVGTFGPDEIKAMTAAYEGALTDLGFADREDPLTELIAKSIVNVTATGGPMRLFGIESEDPGHELHSYECPNCQRIETAVRPLFH
jgi:hypothetical protein